jgi:hypothetical protein
MLCDFLFVEKVLHRRPDPVLVVFHRGVFLQAREKDVRVRACVRACVCVRLRASRTVRCGAFSAPRGYGNTPSAFSSPSLDQKFAGFPIYPVS